MLAPGQILVAPCRVTAPALWRHNFQALEDWAHRVWTTIGNDVAPGVKSLPSWMVDLEGGHGASPGPRRELGRGHPTERGSPSHARRRYPATGRGAGRSCYRLRRGPPVRALAPGGRREASLYRLRRTLYRRASTVGTCTHLLSSLKAGPPWRSATTRYQRAGNLVCRRSSPGWDPIRRSGGRSRQAHHRPPSLMRLRTCYQLCPLWPTR
jgi:hypothetical protein